MVLRGKKSQTDMYISVNNFIINELYGEYICNKIANKNVLVTACFYLRLRNIYIPAPLMALNFWNMKRNIKIPVNIGLHAPQALMLIPFAAQGPAFQLAAPG